VGLRIDAQRSPTLARWIANLFDCGVHGHRLATDREPPVGITDLDLPYRQGRYNL